MSNRSKKFSEIWYVDDFQQKNATKKLFLYFGLSWPFFFKNSQKTAKKVGKIQTV